jgi:tetratricopeptide (TPR) repeat protein
MKLYNKCQYNDAIKQWASCDFGDTADRLTYLEEKCREMSGKISVKEGEAEKYFNKGEMLEGVKKVRVILTLCPMNEFASDKLNSLKDSIGLQVKKYYLEGVDQYTNGNIIEAIGSWEKAISLDPAGNTAANARENIDKAKKKLENLKNLK